MIYSGEITDWSSVGGNAEKIRAFQRPEDSGSQTALLQFMGEVPVMEAPRENIEEGMGGIINQVAEYKNHKMRSALHSVSTGRKWPVMK